VRPVTGLTLDTLNRDVLHHIFEQLETDENRYRLGSTCRLLWAIRNQRDYRDRDAEHIIGASIAPDAQNAFTLDFVRQYLQLNNVAGRRAFRKAQSAAYGSMQNYLASNHYMGLFNMGFLNLCNDLARVDTEPFRLDFLASNLRLVPREIGLHTKLKVIELSANELRELPKEIYSLVDLISLYVMRNKIGRLPAGFGQLRNLVSLRLDFNALTEIPQAVCEASSLRVLSLEGNQIREIPYYIRGLTDLRMLSITYNHIDFISPAIDQLQNLENLYLDRNELTLLPSTICTLKSLESLWLGHNHLGALPAGMGALTKLKQLTLEANWLYSLPEDIRFLPLLYLDIHGNQFLLENGSYPQWMQAWIEEDRPPNVYFGH